MLSENTSPLAKRSVLCVQPNEDFHPALRLALSKYRLVMAPNALEAIRALNSGAFDAYVLDYWLPDWSGVSLCRQIRQTDPHAPICFFSSADSPEQKKRALRAGAQAFLSAPDGAAALTAKLRTWLEYADLSAMRAKIDEEEAVQQELQRRAAVAVSQSDHARQRARDAIERAAQIRARKAFIEKGGTQATFERWWPQTIASALANHQASTERSLER
jgi:DNA-binding response OmpR family regulator